MSQQAMVKTRMAVAGFDWATRRVERFHQLIAGFATQQVADGPSSERTYEFVRTLGREAGETVNGALMMIEAARASTPRRDVNPGT